VLPAACVGLLLLVYVDGVGVERNFRRRWLKVPGIPDEFNFGFQPSEIAKFLVIIFLAYWLSRPRLQDESYVRGFLPAAGVLMVVTALIAKEDLGTGLIVAATGFALLVIGGYRLWQPLTLVPVALSVLFLAMDETRWARLFRHSEGHTLDVLGRDYQIVMSQRALANGGFWGQGLGEGSLKLGFLPLRSSDFVFAHMTEELGLVVSGAILLLYAVLIHQGGRIVSRARDRFGQLIAFGITLVFGMQAFVHAGVVTKLLPNKGINLPFISAGGTGLIIMAAAAGLLAAVARATTQTETAVDPPVEPSARRPDGVIASGQMMAGSGRVEAEPTLAI
jgi:cell division protein FtsW